MIPAFVKEIGEDAFSGCKALTNVTFPEGMTTIGDWAFLDCNALKSVTIPESVTSIGKYAFSKSVKICGCKGTCAEKYASEMGCEFQRLMSAAEEAEQRAAQEKAEDERKAAAEKAEVERKAKIEALNQEKASLQTELANLRGLFSGKRRKEIEARLSQIEAELKKLG
jgi:hypothetical protein